MTSSQDRTGRRALWLETRSLVFDWASSSEAKLAVRLIRRQPLFAATAIVSLAIGLGLTTLGLSILEATTFASLPFEDGDRYVRIGAHTEPDGRPVPIDAESFRALRQQAGSFQHVGALGGDSVTLSIPSDQSSTSSQLTSIRANLVTPRSLDRTGARPIKGRLFDRTDSSLAGQPIVLISERLWRSSWGSSAETIGSVATINGVDHTIVGILPDGIEFPASGELWLPIRDDLTTSIHSSPGDANIFAVLSENTTRTQARLELDLVLGSTLIAESGATVRAEIRSYTEAPPGWELGMGVLIIVLTSILLVIASNVANLIFARTSARASEMAVRTALGAPRRRLVGQIFVEVAAMAMVAALLGSLFAQAVLRRFANQIDELPFWVDLTPGPRTLITTVCLAVLASAVAGILPALRVTRRSSASSLQAGLRTGPGFGRFGRVAIVGQMALSIALLAGALAFARGLVLHSTPSDSLPRGRVLTAQISGGSESLTYKTVRSAIDDLAANSGASIQSFGLATHLPRIDPPLQRFLFENAKQTQSQSAPVAWVTPGFLESLGGSPLSGRLFREQDLEPGAPRVAIVNDRFVERFLGGASPLGQRLILQSNEDARNLVVVRDGEPEERTFEIVGVVADLGLSASDPESAAGFYLPLSQSPLYYLSLQTDGAPMLLEPGLRSALADLDPALQLRRVQPLEAVGSEDRAMMTGFGGGLTGLGMVALLLSMVGIYSMMSFAVTRRTREIGIRTALGATRGQLLFELMAGTAQHLIAGSLIGAALALVVLQSSRNLLVTRLPTAEPWILPVLLISMLLSGAIACYLPARRALDTHPSEALRID